MIIYFFDLLKVMFFIIVLENEYRYIKNRNLKLNVCISLNE